MSKNEPVADGADDEAGAVRPRTMAAFAAAAGVSRPTASKFFADPAGLRPAVRARLEDAAARLGYRPNPLAVNFNRKRPRLIGVLVPAIEDPFYAEVVRQVERGAIDTGYWPVVLSSHADPRLEARAAEALLAMNVAGALVAPLGDGEASPHLAALAAAVPTAFVDARAGTLGAFVGTDNSQSVGLIVDYLCRTGPPPCFLAMPAVNRNARERRDAYASAMHARGHAPAVVEPARGGWDFEAIGFETAERALAAAGFPSRVVLCANDRLAFGVLAAAYARGVPLGRGAADALRVAGHDDHPLSRYACPPLTTVAQDVAGIARAALAAVTGEGPPDAIAFEARLVMRGSA